VRDTHENARETHILRERRRTHTLCERDTQAERHTYCKRETHNARETYVMRERHT